MPSITLSFSTGGPLINAMIAPSWPRQQAMRAADVAVPSPTFGTFLVDTGASSTVVDASLIAPLGLQPTGAVMFHTPSTGATALPFSLYDVMLLIPGPGQGKAWIIEALAVAECNLSAQGIQGLIGRDVLDRAMLVYNGPENHFSIAY